jgi:hypothetical protein
MLGLVPPLPDVEPATLADVPALPASAGPSLPEQAKLAPSESRPNSETFVEFLSATVIGTERNEALVVSITTSMSPGLARNIHLYLHQRMLRVAPCPPDNPVGM